MLITGPSPFLWGQGLSLGPSHEMFHAWEDKMSVGQGTYPSLPSRKSAGMSAVRLVLSWIISM